MSETRSLEEMVKEKEYWSSRISMKQDELKEAYNETVKICGPKVIWLFEQKNHELFVAASKEAFIAGEIAERERALKEIADANAAAAQSTEESSQSEPLSESPL